MKRRRPRTGWLVASWPVALAVVAILLAAGVPSTAASATSRTWHQERTSSTVLAKPHQWPPMAAVSCPRVHRCIAVGQLGDYFLAMRRTANGWQRMATPRIRGSLNDVSCVSMRWCAAAGTADGPVVLIWNGTRWKLHVPPKPKNAARLLRISCAAKNRCGALGWTWDGNTFSRYSVMRTAHGWRLAAIGGEGDEDISCPGIRRCFAVGTRPRGTGTRPVVQVWRGRRWTTMATPDRNMRLHAVSCATTRACTAVGTGGVLLNLYGGSWHVQRMRVADSVELFELSCGEPRTCTVVGESERPDGSSVTAAFSVTRSGWAREVTANPSTHDNELLGVDCVTVTSCVAVGDYGYGPYTILVESTW